MKSAALHNLFTLLLIVLVGLSGCRSNKSKNLVADSVSIISWADTGATMDTVPLKNMFGVNSYEWNFEENPAEPNKRDKIYEANMALIKCFSAVRHYMNWNKLENSEGNYTYNPTYDGGWYYDVMYARCKQDSILVLADLKNLPAWMMNTYPADERDDENVPADFGADRSKPASYIIQARTAFQFAARYGYNKMLTLHW
ncbi:hypothetical protein FPZ43_02390 [Mucilaginibacter pallidiroseus]|uniref:Glycoside hydrolase family 42 N-terminal domain-containing protein n=1 Tax=Mucilaginibacter pallidiroseus TaxID=2599295 RepID=A0A563UJ12_9SPHI|nr:hypothetical protein [Mucilaginibacter pallidiroseus]TWR31345.1 hypothetical protein FPZ43_02390 [Mucilaginibacter pallidiroseus]